MAIMSIVLGFLDWDVKAGARPMRTVVIVSGLRRSRVRLFESTTQIRWYIPSKAEYHYETDSEQVPRGKVEKNSEERVKKDVKSFKKKLTEPSLTIGRQSIAADAMKQVVVLMSSWLSVG